MQKVIDYLLKDLLLVDGDTIVVGVSGGPDSMALLSILKSIQKGLSINIVCAHVNHNVRRASKSEKEFLEKWCLKNAVVFESMTIENYGDDNFHNEARSIRYQFFDTLVKKYHAKYLMTAHHGDDLIETILMRIVRGSTLKGYSGFGRIVNYNDYLLVRPLIDATKKEIEQYNKKNKIPFVTDSSNSKTKYTRNRYRKYLLPFLKKEDPNVHEKFKKFSVMLAEYSDFIEKQGKKAFNKIYNSGVFNINEYLLLEKIVQDKVIYQILEQIYQDDLMLVNDRHVSLIRNLISSTKKNSYIYLPNNVKIVKSYDKLEFNISATEVNNYEIELLDYAVLPNGKHLEIVAEADTNGNDICRISKEDISFPLYIRTRKHGDKMNCMGMDGHQKVKEIFIDKKISLSERDLWPILVDSKDTIIWIPGLKKSKFNRQKNDKCDIIIKYY